MGEGGAWGLLGYIWVLPGVTDDNDDTVASFCTHFMVLTISEVKLLHRGLFPCIITGQWDGYSAHAPSKHFTADKMEAQGN